MKKLRLQRETVLHLQNSNYRMRDLETPGLKNKEGGGITPLTPSLTEITRAPTGCNCTPRWVAGSLAFTKWAHKKIVKTYESYGESAQDPSIIPSATVQPSLPMSW